MNESVFDYAGAAGGYLDILGFPYCRGRYLNYCEKDQGQYDNHQDVTWVSGAAFGFEKQLLISWVVLMKVFLCTLKKLICVLEERQLVGQQCAMEQ